MDKTANPKEENNMKIIPNYVKVRPKNKESVKAWRCAIEVERVYDWLIDIRVQKALQYIKKIIDKEEII